MTGYLYRHIRLDTNQPFYIGISKVSDPYRASKKSKRNKIWSHIVNKTNYKIEILFNDLPIKELIQKEKEYIKLYGKICDGTGTLANLTNGGEGTLGSRHNLGRKHSEETKEKIRKNKIGICHNYNENLRKPILQFDLNGNFIKEYPSINSTKLDGFDESCIIACCKNKRKTHKKYIWKYVESNQNKY